MIRNFLCNILLPLLISSIHSQLSDNERKNLLEKIFKRNNPNDFEKLFFPAKDSSIDEEEEQKQKYEPEKN